MNKQEIEEAAKKAWARWRETQITTNLDVKRWDQLEPGEQEGMKAEIQSAVSGREVRYFYLDLGSGDSDSALAGDPHEDWILANFTFNNPTEVAIDHYKSWHSSMMEGDYPGGILIICAEATDERNDRGCTHYINGRVASILSRNQCKTEADVLAALGTVI